MFFEIIELPLQPENSITFEYEELDEYEDSIIIRVIDYILNLYQDERMTEDQRIELSGQLLGFFGVDTSSILGSVTEEHN